MMTAITKHAAFRIGQRNIPASLICEAIERGRKTFLPDRNAVEYRMNNILGLRGVSLVVVAAADGAVITSYVDMKKRRRDRA